MYFVYLESSETCVTVKVTVFKILVFSNLILIWVSYSANNHHVVAVGLQEASLKMGPVLSLKCVMLQYVRWRRSKMCVSLNAIHHRENTISWHGCTASSVLSRLGSIPFFET